VPTAATLLDGLSASTAATPVAQLRVLGGAMARVPADATAFAHRKRGISVTVAAMYADAEERPVHQAWATDLADQLTGGDPAAYAGFLGDEGDDRVRAAYPGGTWERLAAVKAQHDPENVFRLNQNVPPA
jgi:Berberine and berberine like